MDSRDLLLLGLLRRWGMHGYQLVDFMEKRLAFMADLKKPTAYALLERLRRSGYVKVKTEREGKRPPRRVYQIAPAGEAHFFDLLRANLPAYAPAHSPDATGLYFLDELPADEVRALLRQRLSRIEERLAEMKPKVAEHRGKAVHPVMEHHMAHLETDRAWLVRWLRRAQKSRPRMSDGDA